MMKKILAAAMAVFALFILTGCTRKPQEPNGIVEAVGAGYETVDQSGENRIQVASGESRVGVIQVDLLSETGTLMRPYIFVEPGVDFYKIEHSEADFAISLWARWICSARCSSPRSIGIRQS